MVCNAPRPALKEGASGGPVLDGEEKKIRGPRPSASARILVKDSRLRGNEIYPGGLSGNLPHHGRGVPARESTRVYAPCREQTSGDRPKGRAIPRRKVSDPSEPDGFPTVGPAPWIYAGIFFATAETSRKCRDFATEIPEARPLSGALGWPYGPKTCASSIPGRRAIGTGKPLSRLEKLHRLVGTSRAKPSGTGITTGTGLPRPDSTGPCQPNWPSGPSTWARRGRPGACSRPSTSDPEREMHSGVTRARTLGPTVPKDGSAAGDYETRREVLWKISFTRA